MDEHDDDQTSEVQEEATEETESFPDMAEDSDEDSSAREPLNVDQDETEI